MKKLFILVAIFAIPFCGFAKSRFFINLNAGWDHTTNKYYSYNNYNFFDQDGAEFSWGADLGYKFSDAVRFRVESRFGKYSYGQEYTGAELLKTTMDLNYFNINPHLDFRVWNKNKLELFVSPGLKLEYISDSNQETELTDGSVSDAGYVSSKYAENMTGFVGSAILKYNINSKWGVTLSPEYTLYFKKLYDKNDNNMARFSTRLGIEYTF